MALEFRVLGEVALLRDGARLDLGGRRPRALLAALLLDHGRPVLLESLIDRVWSDEPPDSAAKTIQVYVSRLRAQLGEERARLASRKGGYELSVRPGELDADAFAADADAARRSLEAGAVAAALAAVERAGARWRGRPFGDLADEPFLRGDARRLEDLAAEVEELRARALVDSSRAEEAVRGLRQLVTEQRGRESAWAQLLLALYAAGRQADALAAYHEVRAYLDEELGIEPGPDLEAAHLAVLQQSAPIVAPTVGAPASAVAAARPAADALIGRDADVQSIERAFDEGARLVTLVGPGGIGKTAICRAVVDGRRRAAGAPVTFVELDAIRDPALVASTVATALGGDGDPAEQIGSASALLALDNFEQVIDAASWVASLLEACPMLGVVVTSREPLRVDGERVHAVGPLEEDPARDLFLARGRRVRPDLQPSPAIDAACRRLDRLPLAIELAAARMNLLSPEALVARLDRVLDVLASGPRDAADRQRTLRSTIAWSYDLLDEPLRPVFRRMSVFAGGFGVDAAESVAGASLDDVEALLGHSLITARYDTVEPRFLLLETIRAFAAERMDAEDDGAATRTRHAAWARDLVAVATAAGGERPGTARLAADLDNFRAAMAWATTAGDDETRLRIAVGLSDVWQTRGHLAEARRWLESGLDTADIPDDLRAEAYDDASSMALRQGDIVALKALAERLLQLAERLEQPRRRVAALAKLAQVRLRSGDTDGARALHESALSIAAMDADKRPLLVSITGQANADLLAGRADLAAAAFEQAVSLALEVGRPESVATAWFNLGLARVIDARDNAAARSALRAALERYVALDDLEGVGYVLVTVGALLAADDAASAAVALGAAHAALEAVGAELEPVEARLRDQTHERLHGTLGAEALDAGMRRGSELDPEARLSVAADALRRP